MGAMLRSVPPLVARITLFAIFAPTGWGKLHNLPKVAGYFSSLGIPWPSFSAGLVGFTELVCGVLLLVGLFTRYATIPLIVNMSIAIATAKRDQIGGVLDVLGFEEFVYIVLLLWLLVAGPGLVSIDGVVGAATRRRQRQVA
jgi:putative oxidoreductase